MPPDSAQSGGAGVKLPEEAGWAVKVLSGELCDLTTVKVPRDSELRAIIEKVVDACPPEWLLARALNEEEIEALLHSAGMSMSWLDQRSTEMTKLRSAAALAGSGREKK